MRMGMGVGMGVGIVDNHDVFFPFSPKIQRCRFERLELEGGWVIVMTHESWCSFPKFQRCRFESGSWSFLEPRMCCRVGFSSLFVHFPLFFSSHKTKSLYIHHYVHDSPIPISLLSLSLTFYGDKKKERNNRRENGKKDGKKREWKLLLWGDCCLARGHQPSLIDSNTLISFNPSSPSIQFHPLIMC